MKKACLLLCGTLIQEPTNVSRLLVCQALLFLDLSGCSWRLVEEQPSLVLSCDKDQQYGWRKAQMGVALSERLLGPRRLEAE